MMNYKLPLIFKKSINTTQSDRIGWIFKINANTLIECDIFKLVSTWIQYELATSLKNLSSRMNETDFQTYESKFYHSWK